MDAHSPAGRADGPGLGRTRELRLAGEVALDIVQTQPGQDRHPVPLAVPMVRETVAETGQGLTEQRREGLIRELRLLQTDHIGLPVFEPWQQARDARLDRVDVPGSDSHP